MISTTSFAAVVFGMALSAGSIPVTTWKSDYSEAMASAVAQQKPLAVFIGRGEAGYSGVVGGEVPAEAGKLLTGSFVCLYVNTDTADGKALAGAFGVSKGLVISSKGGAVQALRHGGTVPAADLTGYLARYSAASAVVTTEKAGEGRVVTAAAYAPAVGVIGGCANGRCGVSSPFPTYAPAYQGFSSCPNGRCPNAR